MLHQMAIHKWEEKIKRSHYQILSYRNYLETKLECFLELNNLRLILYSQISIFIAPNQSGAQNPRDIFVSD